MSTYRPHLPTDTREEEAQLQQAILRLLPIALPPPHPLTRVGTQVISKQDPATGQTIEINPYELHPYRFGQTLGLNASRASEAYKWLKGSAKIPRPQLVELGRIVVGEILALTLEYKEHQKAINALEYRLGKMERSLTQYNPRLYSQHRAGGRRSFSVREARWTRAVRSRGLPKAVTFVRLPTQDEGTERARDDRIQGVMDLIVSISEVIPVISTTTWVPQSRQWENVVVAKQLRRWARIPETMARESRDWILGKRPISRYGLLRIIHELLQEVGIRRRTTREAQARRKELEAIIEGPPTPATPLERQADAPQPAPVRTPMKSAPEPSTPDDDIRLVPKVGFRSSGQLTRLS